MSLKGGRLAGLAMGACAVILTSCSWATPRVTVVTVTPPPPATEVLNVNPLDADGQVREGYQLDEEEPGPDIDVGECSEASRSAVSPGTYACGASGYQADACWRHASDDLVCIDQPWDRRLFLRTVTGELPQTEVPDEAEPLGLQLEDGSRYRHRNGTSSGLPPEGYNDLYYCVSGPCSDDPAVLTAVMAADSAPVVDQTSQAWKVLVGQLAQDEVDVGGLPEPVHQRVVRAWFITAQ